MRRTAGVVSGQKRSSLRDRGISPEDGRNPDAWDAEPGGPALRDTPFLPGLLSMRKREESIYRAAGGRVSASGRMGDSLSAGQAADFRAAGADLLARQEEEGTLFRDLVGAAVALSMPGANGAPVLQPPERLNPRLAEYVALALQEDFPQRAAPRPGLAGAGNGYGPMDAGADGNGARAVSREGESLWIHARPLAVPAEDGDSSSARGKGRKERFSLRGTRRGETASEEGKRRRLLTYFLRLFTLGMLFASGYLILAGRACSLAGT